MLKISVLGQLQVSLDGVPITNLSTGKVQALLAYLVVENAYPHRREKLAGLLWSDFTDSSARTNLRQSIARLRRIIPAEAILATRQTIRFDPDFAYTLDLAQFTTLLVCYQQQGSAADLREAVQLYRGDFLNQLWLEGSPAFEEWLLLKREWLRREMIDALHQLASEALSQHHFDEATQFARQQLEIDSLNELAHQQLMQGLAGLGRRTEALQQFERCRQVLWAELQSPPSGSTVALADQIRAGFDKAMTPNQVQVNQPSAESEASVDAQKPPQPIPHNLPHQLTSIVGRDMEIDTLTQLLVNPASRLVTIVGPGGMGKTRLALAVAHHLLHLPAIDSDTGIKWTDGLFFVPLQAVSTVDGIVTTIADTLGFRFSGTDTPRQQIIHYLKPKRLLLILDNFEHLLAGVPVLVEIGQTCPDIHFLITSRERLNLQQEHIFPLHGLAYPHQLTSQEETCAAVDLFVKTAQRLQHDFQVDTLSFPFIATICQRVEGMPLALELAASWVHVMALPDIAQNLSHSLELLSSTARDLPDRHRSMRAVFDMTWQLLSDEEQQSFANLSIFQGGFGREAALQVANTTMSQLAALINKSLVRYDASQNRYDLHELLRQYGREKLHEVADRAFAVADQHSAYYCVQLASSVDFLRTISKPVIETPLAINFENISQAWEWAMSHSQVERLQHVVDGFGLLLMRLVRYHEGKARFEQALHLLDSYQPAPSARAIHGYVYAKLLTWGGEFVHYLGYQTQANAMLQQALDILTHASLTELDTRSAQAAALFCLGDTVHSAEAQHYYQQALEISQAAGDRWHEASALQGLSELYLGPIIGSLDQAKAFVEQSLNIHRDIDDPLGVSWNLQTLAEIALDRRELIQAKQLIDESLQIRQQLKLKSGIARCKTMYGSIAFLAGEFDLAIDHYQQSVALWEALSLPSSAVHEKVRLAWALLHQGSDKDAFREAKAASHLFEDEPELNHAIDRAHYILGLHALAQGEHKQGQHYFQLSLEQTVWPRSRGYSLCGLALAEYRLKSTAQARHYLNEALEIALQAEVYLLTLHTLHVATLLLADAGAVSFAHELHNQMIKHPFNANSRWIEDVIYRPLADLFQKNDLNQKQNDPFDEAAHQWRAQTVQACQKLVALLPANGI